MKLRWKCPRCERGTNAPQRMRTDDVRRFCLPCSTATGRLVRRVCPVMEGVRAERDRRRRDKARAKKERTREKDAQRDGARLRRVARFCGPAVLSTFLGISREEAGAILLRFQPGSTGGFNTGTMCRALKIGSGSPRIVRPRPSPTFVEWLRTDGRDAIVATTTHYHLVQGGKVVQDNGGTRRRGRVRFVLLLRGLNR